MELELTRETIYENNFDWLYYVPTPTYSTAEINEWFIERGLMVYDMDDLEYEESFTIFTDQSLVLVGYFEPMDCDSDFWFNNKAMAMEFKLRFKDQAC